MEISYNEQVILEQFVYVLVLDNFWLTFLVFFPSSDDFSALGICMKVAMLKQ